MSDWHEEEAKAECIDLAVYLLYQKQRIEELETKLKQTTTNYQDLIMQVINKYPNETRHETAKRYIYCAEHQDNPPTAALIQEKESDR